MTNTTQNTPFERHCAQLQRQPELTEREELVLAKKWVTKRDRRAGDALVEAHLPLVLRLAKRLRGYGVPRDELMAEGNVGLLRALEKFELRGVRFKTYATYWVRAHMLACAQRQTSIVTAWERSSSSSCARPGRRPRPGSARTRRGSTRIWPSNSGSAKR